jgi:membrane-associated protease RseP (regulator of RpoE activity)
MVDLLTTSMLVFIAILALFFWFDRKNVERQSILLLRKTQKGKRFLTRLGQSLPRVWWLYGMAAVGVGFFISAYIFYWLITMTITSLVVETVPGLAIVLPSPTTELVAVPGVIGIPFWFWIISIFLLILVHEGSHGIMAAREKVKIKSLGWGLLIAIPLAFVEPDEKQLQKEKPMKQLRVFAAGSFGNFILAIIAANLLVFSITTFFVPAGVNYQGLMVGYPAEQANLTGTIIGINNYTIEDLDDLSTALEEIGPEKQVTVTTRIGSGDDFEERRFSLKTVAEPNVTGSTKGFIGISAVSHDFRIKDDVSNPVLVQFFTGTSPQFFGLLFFLFLINIGVGAFNLLPLGPLDGGRMWRIILDKLIPKHSKFVMDRLSWIILFILLLNFAIALT